MKLGRKGQAELKSLVVVLVVAIAALGVLSLTGAFTANLVAEWEELPTTMTHSDDTYYYFEATTTEFSIFAVVAGGQLVTIVCDEAAIQSCDVGGCAGSQTCTGNAWGDCVKDDPECVEQQDDGDEIVTGGLDSTMIIIIALVVVALLVMLMKSGKLKI